LYEEERQKEHRISKIVGARKKAGQVQHHIEWYGGAEAWGSQACTWDRVEVKVATNFLKCKALVGKICMVQFKAGMKVLAKVKRFDAGRQKFFVEYFEDKNGDDDEFLDLVNAEKNWGLVQ
jgi:hypothetical protein